MSHFFNETRINIENRCDIWCDIGCDIFAKCHTFGQFDLLTKFKL